MGTARRDGTSRWSEPAEAQLEAAVFEVEVLEPLVLEGVEGFAGAGEPPVPPEVPVELEEVESDEPEPEPDPDPDDAPSEPDVEDSDPDELDPPGSVEVPVPRESLR